MYWTLGGHETPYSVSKLSLPPNFYGKLNKRGISGQGIGHVYTHIGRFKLSEGAMSTNIDRQIVEAYSRAFLLCEMPHIYITQHIWVTGEFDYLISTKWHCEHQARWHGFLILINAARKS